MKSDAVRMTQSIFSSLTHLKFHTFTEPVWEGRNLFSSASTCLGNRARFIKDTAGLQLHPLQLYRHGVYNYKLLTHIVHLGWEGYCDLGLKIANKPFPRKALESQNTLGRGVIQPNEEWKIFWKLSGTGFVPAQEQIHRSEAGGT